MARRTVHCPCGGEFPIPEVTPSLLHCPFCGEPVRYHAAGDEPAPMKVREDIREPIKPLPPANPYYPLYLLGGGGLVLAAALIGLVFLFSDREAKRHPAFDEGVRARPRAKDEEPFTSIKQIPIIPPTSKKAEPPPYKPAPPPPEFDVADGMARAQRLCDRMNLAGIVSTFYLLSNRPAEHREMQATLSRDEVDFRQLLPHLGDRSEFQSLKEHFSPGDVLTTFNIVPLDATRPKPFVDAIREWLVFAQPGTTVMVVIQRDGRS